MHDKINLKKIKDCTSNNDLLVLKKKLEKFNFDFLQQELIEQKEINAIVNRTKKDIDHAIKYSLEKFIKDLLPILDNLEKACESIKISDINLKFINDETILIKKHFLDVLFQFQVKEIKESNVIFDPKIHEAMSIQFSKEVKSNYVIKILQKGYLLNDRLLRPAMVIVSQ